MDFSEHVDARDVVPNTHTHTHSHHGPSYIEKDATYLCTGETAIFLCTIRYMDLKILDLTHFTRTPQLLMLLRNEWGNKDIFNKRKRGSGGGAVFTGEPGIGECYYCF